MRTSKASAETGRVAGGGLREIRRSDRLKPGLRTGGVALGLPMPGRLKPGLRTGGGALGLPMLGRLKAGVRTEAGFTMVEIALSIGVVAFALVAIIGVLPTGMQVQRDNREDTIVNQDGTFWLDTLRGGSRGMDMQANYPGLISGAYPGSRGVDELTNYVDLITIASGNQVRSYVFGDGRPIGATNTFTNGFQVLGLLSTPKYVYWFDNRERRRTNTFTVTAYVRSLSGAAGEKAEGNNGKFIVVRDPVKGATDSIPISARTFSYRLRPSIVPFNPTPPEFTDMDRASPGWDWTNRYHLLRRSMHLEQNFWEVRLTLDYPAVDQGNTYRVGGNRKVFRTLVSGNMYETNLNQTTTLFWLQPSTFVFAR